MSCIGRGQLALRGDVSDNIHQLLSHQSRRRPPGWWTGDASKQKNASINKQKCIKTNKNAAKKKRAKEGRKEGRNEARKEEEARKEGRKG